MKKSELIEVFTTEVNGAEFVTTITKRDNEKANLDVLPVHYRYIDGMYEYVGLEINCVKYYPIRETKCFYFVVDSFEFSALKRHPSRKCRVRKIGKNATRSYCKPTKIEALASFKYRKEKQILLCSQSLNQAKLSLAAIDDKKYIDDSLSVPLPLSDKF